MITFEDAVRIVTRHIPASKVEYVPLESAQGRVLALGIVAQEDHPPFDASVVDGFAVRIGDVSADGTSTRLPVLATVRAGDQPGEMKQQRGAVRIMTGAPVPHGVEAVIMREHVDEQAGGILVERSVKPGENIRRAGEEMSRGQVVLEPGVVVTPAAAALLAALGSATVPVFAMPSVAVITTGDELLEARSALTPGKVRDANAVFLKAALQNLGIGNIAMQSRIRDDVECIRDALSGALDTSEILLVTGGVSVGDYDYVKPALESLGVTCHFWGVAVKPGKPTFFGTKGQKLVFGLPGNPVAVGVIFCEMVWPVIRTMLHHRTTRPVELPAVLDSPLRNNSGRLEFVRACVYRRNGINVVVPLRKQGSHMISGFAHANCLIPLCGDGTGVESGCTVRVHLLPWVAGSDPGLYIESDSQEDFYGGE